MGQPALKLHDSESFEIAGVELVRELGRGAFSVVYEIRRLGRPYALKISRSAKTELSADSYSSFRREAWTLARLSHPGLPRVHELGETRGRPYVILDLIQGQTLDVSLRQQPLGEADTRALAQTLAGALSQVHRIGLVHRDVKPQNILTDLHSYRLIDFGLAKSIAVARSLAAAKLDDEAAGTFHYAAPEQSGALKRPVDGRSDLYALGAVLFECLTGRLPFVSNDVSEVIRLHATAPAPDLRQLKPEISPELAGIVARLLAKDPDDRFSNAEALIAALGGPNQQPAYVTRLVGRDDELVALRKAQTEVSTEATGRAIEVVGPRGVGKSRLIHEALDPTLLIQAPKDRAIPFSATQAALDRWVVESGEIGAALRSRLQRLDARAFRIAPRLAIALGIDVPTTDVSDRVDGEAQQQAFEIFAQLFIEMAMGAGPSGFTVQVDDWEALGETDRRVYETLARSLAGAPLLLVLCSRSDIGLAEERIELSALNRTGTGELAREYLNATREPERIASELFTRSQGLPYAALEYLDSMLEAGVLQPHWGEWNLDIEGLARLSLPGDVTELIARRVDGVSPSTRTLLSRALRIGPTFDVATLVEICPEPSDEVLQRLREASDHHLVQQDGDSVGSYRFVHEAVIQRLRSVLSEPESKTVHRKIAEALERSAAATDSNATVFARARHWILSASVSQPQAAFNSCKEAGLAALRACSNAEAIELLTHARTIAHQCDLGPVPEVESALGSAYLAESRGHEAAPHFTRALEATRDRAERVHLRHMLIYTAINAQDGVKAIESYEAAYAEAGETVPDISIRQALRSLFELVRGYLAWRFGIGFGRIGRKQGEALRIARELSHLYTNAVVINYLRANPIVETLQIAARDFALAHAIGKSPHLAEVTHNVALVLAYLRRREGSDRLAAHALQLAEDLKAQSTLSRIHLYEAIRLHIFGETRTAEQLMLRTLSQEERWIRLIDYFNGVADLAYNLGCRGYTREALFWIQKAGERRKRLSAGRSHDNRVIESYGMSFQATLGDPRSARETQAKLDASMSEKEKDRSQEAAHFLTNYLANLLILCVEEGELGQPFEDTLTSWDRLGIRLGGVPYHRRIFFAAKCAGRAEQALAATQDREAAVERLRVAVGELGVLAKNYVPMRGHAAIARASLAFLNGEHAEALEALSQADRYAAELDSPWVAYEAARWRARIFKQTGHLPAALREARVGLALAIEHGWIPRARRIASEFGVDIATSLSMASTPAAPARSARTTQSGVGNLDLRRQLDALLQVSRASASVLDPEEVARVALKEACRILKAERALLFLADAKGEKLELKEGRSADGSEVDVQRGYASTIIERVRQTKQAVIVSGTEQGEILGSRSAVVQNLRSIIAAPMLLKNQLLGVVYLDNRIAKGLFTEEDVGILEAIASHVGVAIDTARSAQVELDRQALMQDLSVSAAVQSLFLPREVDASGPGYRLAGHYQPASRCGGDWWWYEPGSEPGSNTGSGNLRIIVGDVTGHGTGSAMVTAAIAGSYQTLSRVRQNGERLPVDALLKEMNTTLIRLCETHYLMTVSALELDTKNGKIRWWGAGCPPVFVFKKDGKASLLLQPSRPMGLDVLEPAYIEAPFEPGDRAFIFTDGISELKTSDGSFLGTRKLLKLVSTLPRDSALLARSELLARVKELQGTHSPEDDITFAILDRVA